jgi:predicted dehydrogenase
MNEAGAVRWGIVSTARINAKLLAGAREATGVDVVAVGSRDRARGEEFAAEYGIGRVHDSYESLLADDDVEAVYIPLPNTLHVPWSVKALEAGKHVLREKPLTRRAADAEAVFDAAERAGRLLARAAPARGGHARDRRRQADPRRGVARRPAAPAGGIPCPPRRNLRRPPAAAARC